MCMAGEITQEVISGEKFMLCKNEDLSLNPDIKVVFFFQEASVMSHAHIPSTRETNLSR